MSFFKPKNTSSSSASSNSSNTPFIGVQAKLNIGKSNDKYEKEADSVADQVVQKKGLFGNDPFFTPTPNIQRADEGEKDVQKSEETEQIQEKPLSHSITTLVQTKLEEESVQKQEEEAVQMMPEEETVQAKAEQEESVQKVTESPIQAKCDTCGSEIVQDQPCTSCAENKAIQKKSSKQKSPGSSFEDRLSSSKGGGTKLDSETRSKMETGIGADFSNVSIHKDSTAVQMSQDIGAKAFTHGSDIYFNKGEYQPDSKEGQHLLAHELTHTVQQGATQPTSAVSNAVQKQEILIQRSPLDDDVEEVVDLLEGWTTSGDSAEILQIFRKYSGSSIRSLMTKLKSGTYSSTIGWSMVEWLMGDLVNEDRKSLIDILIAANAPDGTKFVAYEIVDEHISGYTSDHDSQEIYAYFLKLSDAATTSVLTHIQTKIGGTVESTVDYLFDDLNRLTADRLKDLLYTRGTGPADFAARFTAMKIEDLIAGYTGVSDSTAIVANFERTPNAMKSRVLFLLNGITMARWEQSAEDALMEDMYESDYAKLIELGVPLRPYDIEKHWLEWTWDGIVTGFDYVAGWIEYGVCGLAGAVWGILDAFIQLISVILEFVFIGIPDLIGWLSYFISGGTVGREEYNNVVKFFSGIGQLFGAPGNVISTMWGEVTGEADLIEGPFAECQTAFYWTSRVFRTLTDVALIFLLGYGIVKGAISGGKIAFQLARAGEWGQLLGRIITKPGRIVAAAGGDMLEIVRALGRPARLLDNAKVAVSSVRMAAADQGYWQFLRSQAGTMIANERAFWSEHRTGWLTSAEAEDARILSAEQKIARALDSNTTPEEAATLVDEVDDIARVAEEGANSLLDDVENGRPVERAPERPQAPNPPSVAAQNLAAETGVEAATLAGAFSDAQMEELLDLLGSFTTNMSRDRVNAYGNYLRSNIERGRSAQKMIDNTRRLSQMEHAELDAFLEEFGLRPTTVRGWRGNTVIEDGNLDEGWVHIDSRHITGNHPDGPGDLFPPSTTRAEIERVAQTIVNRGQRISPMHRRMQTFEMRISVGGQSFRVRLNVDTSDGRIITIFPVITGP